VTAEPPVGDEDAGAVDAGTGTDDARAAAATADPVVLPTEVYVSGAAREAALDGLRSLVDNAVGDLDVRTSIGVRDDRFATVRVRPVDGASADATAARNALREAWGTLPDADPSPLDPGETYVAPLDSWDADGLSLRVGGTETVRVPADELGLGPGGADSVVERFGLVQHLPLRFVAGDPPRLADAERDRLYEWTRGDGRVTVNSATRAEVRATVNRAGHAQDILTVERLGLLEQSIVCKEGTDPPGLIASIGEYLPAELRAVVP
jgi:hypothetical protein